MQNMNTIAPEDKVPLQQKIAFGIGGQMDFLAAIMVTSTLWMPFFNIGLKLSPITLGLILMAYRAWDALSDPIIGSISDNARTRWGRRRPFMFIGALITALIYPFLWNIPDGWSDQATYIYLIVIGLIYFTCFTTW